jgi:hypothetical protein
VAFSRRVEGLRGGLSSTRRDVVAFPSGVANSDG